MQNGGHDMRARGLALGLAVVAAVFLGGDSSNFIQQSGVVTTGHTLAWVQTGAVQDAGSVTSPKINALGLYGLSGSPLCITNRTTPGPYGSTPYSQFCLGIDSGQAYLRVDSYFGAPPLNMVAIVNGTVVPIGGGGGGNANVRRITSGSTDTASQADQTIAWASGAALAKTQTLYICNSSTRAFTVNVKDEIGTAGTYGIVIVGSGGNTIDGAGSYVVNFNYQSTSLTCDGAGNWMIL